MTSKFTQKINSFDDKAREFLLNTQNDQALLNVFKSNNITDVDTTDSISSGIANYCIEDKNIQDLFDLILFRTNNNLDLSIRLFNQINEILISLGLKKDDQKPKMEIKKEEYPEDEDAEHVEESQKTNQTEATKPETEETAEDILKEIENPTPLVSSSLEILKRGVATESKNVSQTENTGLEDYSSPLSAQPQSQPQSQPQPTPAPTTENQTQTPTMSVMPTKDSLKKEDQLKAKLDQPTIQPEKSTYYKIDPYREQF